jgi:deoxyribose-phosphate aldolase
MTSSSEYERIVEEVTRRVLAQLDGPLSSVCAPRALVSVCSGAGGECEACGRCAELRPDDIAALRSAGAARLSSASGIGKVRSELAKLIDHTLLKPEATRDQLRKICEEAVQYGFYSVCVNSANVRYCANMLRGSDVKVVAVVGFPLGAMSPQSKAFETKQAVRDGAREIDMVVNIGKLKTGEYDCVLEDIEAVVAAAEPYPVKVIIETSALTDEEKVAASALCSAGGARFVKTSTGFGKGGATAQDVALIRRVVGERMEIKASGGIKNAQDVDAMVSAGATRIGASASVTIVTGGTSKSSY